MKFEVVKSDVNHSSDYSDINLKKRTVQDQSALNQTSFLVRDQTLFDNR